MSEPAVEDGNLPGSPAARRGFPALLSDHRLWLAIFVTVFFVVSVWSGVTAYFGMSYRLGAGNLMIGMQSLSSTTHGYIPFFESEDCLDKVRCSFLIVHPGLAIMLPMALLYAVWPSALAVFTVQSLAVALAAIPLYYLTREVTQSSSKALFAAGLYLVWAPLLAGEAFSFGLESFLPLEMFTIAALWQAKRYRIGLVAAVVAFLTFEINPVFVFLIGLFFLSPAIQTAFRGGRQVLHRWNKRQIRLGPGVVIWVRWCLRGLRKLEVRATLVLMISSVGALLLIFGFMNVFGAQLIGAPVPATNYGVASLFFDNSGSQQMGLPLSVVLHSPGILLSQSQTPLTAEYWLIMFALVGFIPLLSLRSLIISVPWIGYTFLADSFRFATIGLAADSIAAVPVFLGLAYGLSKLPSMQPMSPHSLPDSPGELVSRLEQRENAVVYRPSRRRLGLWLGVIATVVIVNLLLSSVVPILPDLNANLGEPFRGDYFLSPYPATTGFAAVEELISAMPPQASVGVPLSLSALVANDLHAYILTPGVLLKRLPFNTTDWPEYALVDAFGTYLPPTLLTSLEDNSVYSIRGFVASTSVGPVLLYERGYHGPPQEFGPAFALPSTSELPGNGLSPGPAGIVVTSPQGSSISSRSNITSGGTIVHSGTFFLPPGNYIVRTEAKVTALEAGGNSSAIVASVGVQGFGSFSQHVQYPNSSFVSGVWTILTWTIATTEPVLYVELTCSLSSVRYSLAIANMSIQSSARA
jgi:uncharacterized membrane protein